jgi:hypothetical protein
MTVQPSRRALTAFNTAGHFLSWALCAASWAAWTGVLVLTSSVYHNIYEVGPLSSVTLLPVTRIVLLVAYTHRYILHLANLVLLVFNLFLAARLCARADGFGRFLGTVCLEQLILGSVATGVAIETLRPYQILMTDVDRRPVGSIVVVLSLVAGIVILAVWLSAWGLTRRERKC